MVRQRPRAERLESQRASKEQRVKEVEESEEKLNAEYWQNYARTVLNLRNTAERKAKAADTKLEAADVKLTLCKKLGDEAGTEAPIDDAEVEAAARRVALRAIDEQLAAERAEAEAEQSVRIKWRGRPPIERELEDPLPAGCRVFRGALPLAVVERALPELQKLAEESADVTTRVHMYLDVDGIERKSDVTWFKRGRA